MRKLNPDAPGPAHVQIAAALRDAIEAGEFQPGQAVPPRGQLIEHFGVANATISRAIATLQEEGLLVGRPGSGVFVRLHREKPPFPGGNVYLVVDGSGVAGAHFDRDRADRSASAREGVVVSLPILADYRKETERG
jgi:GntR family transcriptional regulator